MYVSVCRPVQVCIVFMEPADQCGVWRAKKVKKGIRERVGRNGRDWKEWK